MASFVLMASLDVRFAFVSLSSASSLALPSAALSHSPQGVRWS